MKKLKVMLLTCIISILMIGISYATESFEVKMYPSIEEASEGETITIPIKIENVNVEDGIVAYSTLLTYDSSIFEKAVVTNTEEWGKPLIVENLIQATTANMQTTKDDQVIIILSLKVRSNAKLGETEISLTNFEASDGENTIYNEGASTKIKIADKAERIAGVLLNNDWTKSKNMIIALIIAIVTILIIIVITIYYIQHKNCDKKEDKVVNKTKKDNDDVEIELNSKKEIKSVSKSEEDIKLENEEKKQEEVDTNDENKEISSEQPENSKENE